MKAKTPVQLRKARKRYQVPMSPDTLVVDNSIMGDVMKCSTLAVMRHGLGLRPPTEGAALTVGQVGHEALAVWLETGGDVEAAMRQWDTAWDRDGKAAIEALAPDDIKERARLAGPRVRQILLDWLETHPLASWPLEIQTTDVELPVSAPLLTLADGREVVFVALFDALGKRATGGLYTVDHKLRNNVTDWWKAKQMVSSQFTGHRWLGLTWDLPLTGTYVNVLELPHAKVSKAKCRDHGVPYVECDLQHPRHVLFSTVRTSLEILYWERTMQAKVPAWIKLKERVKTLADVAKVPMEGRFNEACTFCGFKAWCDAGRPVGGRATWFAEGTRFWDPLAERRPEGMEE